jgi:3-deoxy-manno-octulosonate cytidylyltransferase (CMP-KDO synthetase)
MENIRYKKQVCIYSYFKEELIEFLEYGRKSYLENIEDIEILRFFEFNKKIKMFETKKSSLAVDVPSDIEKVEKELNKKTPGK